MNILTLSQGKGQTQTGEGKGTVSPATPPVPSRRVRALSLPVIEMEHTNSFLSAIDDWRLSHHGVCRCQIISHNMVAYLNSQ
jgi:hypothetical protein